MIIFKRNMSLIRPPVARTNGVGVRYVTQIKHLGLTTSERILCAFEKQMHSYIGQLYRILRHA